MWKKRNSRLRRTITGRKRAFGQKVVCSSAPKVSVIIPVMNERGTIAAVIREAGKVHPESEVIVVCNGSVDGTERIARRMGARVITFNQPLGHDVGRSLGAGAAKGDILLFVDGDFVIPAHQLRPLVQAVEQARVDIALNRYMGPVNRYQVHSVVLAKHALNTVLSHPRLLGASMTTIPHALSRRALQLIGVENLAVPPKAQAIAMHKGLRVDAVHFIDVGGPNRRRGRRLKRQDPLERLIVGDHLEAMDWYMKNTDRRGRLTDLDRVRERVNE